MLGSGHKPEPSDEPSAMTPLVDIYEDDGAVTVTTDLPGCGRRISTSPSPTARSPSTPRSTAKSGRAGTGSSTSARVGTYVRTLHMSGNVDPG